MRSRGFSDNPDRRAASLERLARDARDRRHLEEEALCRRVAEELARCIAEGLSTWPAIRPRLAALAPARADSR